jgi:hypothetical protein
LNPSGAWIPRMWKETSISWWRNKLSKQGQSVKKNSIFEGRPCSYHMSLHYLFCFVCFIFSLCFVTTQLIIPTPKIVFQINPNKLAKYITIHAQTLVTYATSYYILVGGWFSIP